MFLLLDIHRNILSAQALLKFHADSISNIEILLKPSNICVSVCRNSLFYQYSIVMLEDFLRPCTVSSVCCKNVSDCGVTRENNVVKLKFQVSEFCMEASNISETIEILFRCQISNSSVIDSCTLSNISSKDFKDVMHDEYKPNHLYSIICTDCGSLLTKSNMKFQSVCKYYEGMLELAETSFCHKHSDNSGVQMNTDTLYIGDMHFYFHYSILKFLMLSESNNTYRCLKCSSILSFNKKMDNLHYIGFFCDKIMLIKSETEVNDYEKYKLDTCLISFCSIIQDLLKTSCKLYLQCKIGEKTEVLLLWFNSQRVVQFLQDEMKYEELHYETEFKGKEVFKVLYCICPSDSELSKKWKHAFNVEFFQISDNMMNVIRKLLQKNSKYFPDGHKTDKEFSFGYLPAYVPML